MVLIDPPSGWMYGFPKPYNPETDDYEQMLKDAGYPERDIPFALEHSRYITK